jgi:hypothetical protein
MATSTICPQCGQEAPIVYQGVVPHCTACGAVRAPLSSASVNLAGKPARVGSAFARVLGWLVLAFGGSVALAVAGLLLAVGWPMGALAIGLPIGLVTLLVGIALVRGGNSLAASASQSEQATRTQALLAMAAHRGAVTARDAAQALNVGVAEADAMLTDLAKRDPDRVAVDVDDQGIVWYRVAAAPGEPIPRTRIGADVRAVEDVEEPTAGTEDRKRAGA